MNPESAVSRADVGPVIAIDGPAGSGKSTLGAALADRLGYTYFDSGVAYRALTWLALERKVDVSDEVALVSLSDGASLRVTLPSIDDGRQATVLMDGHDVTWAIRSAGVDHNVSHVSAHPRVREVITDWLRTLASGGQMVMVGRDIGTVVLPHATLKIYLTASGEERAKRRLRQLEARREQANYDHILGEIERRDSLDSGREAAPLRPAADAIHMDSDSMTVDEEVDHVMQLLRGRLL